MSTDLKIVDSCVQELATGFSNIRDTLNLGKDDQAQPNRTNVGHDLVVSALNDFNAKVADTRIKYQKKTEKLTDFLKNVSSGSDDADQQIAASLKNSTQQQKP